MKRLAGEAMPKSRCLGLAILFATFIFGLSLHAGQGGGPMPADETVKTFKLADGLEATVWAGEPGMVNPTNIDVDSKGRIWVVEGANYRGKSKIRPEGDRIMILEDKEGKGVCDSYKVFVQDPALLCPLGICVLGNKVYVSQSPTLWIYTIDESGDKPVGPPEILFTGFTGVNHDHGLHSGMFGPDGRLYFNSGNEGMVGANLKNGKGEVLVDSTGSNPFPKGTTFRGHPKAAGEGYKQGMAFRCNPDGTDLEVLGYNFRNNFEVTVDSFGTAWQSDNDDDGNQGVRINYVMEGGNFGYVEPKSWAEDLTRYPTQTRQDAEWHQRQPGIVPNLLHTGGGSPTGICVYEGDLLPEKYRGALIHCDAGPNVLRAYIPTPVEAGYKTESINLIKAGDRWFRPSDVCVGLDGAVYVADWYDPGVGGHAMGDDKAGSQRGRIYRLAPTGYKPAAVKVDLTSVAGQIAALSSPNLATRYVGYQKLVAGGPDAIAALKELYKSPNPRLKARALWILARSAEGSTIVKEALKDSNVDIRIAAFRAARLIKMDMIPLSKEMLNDANPAVWREVALAMNYQPTDKCMDILVALGDKINPDLPEGPVYDPNIRNKSDSTITSEETERFERVKHRWFVEAFGIACTGREKEVLEAWTKDGKNKDPKVAEVVAWRMNKKIPDPAPKKPK